MYETLNWTIGFGGGNAGCGLGSNVCGFALVKMRCKHVTICSHVSPSPILSLRGRGKLCKVMRLTIILEINKEVS